VQSEAILEDGIGASEIIGEQGLGALLQRRVVDRAGERPGLGRFRRPVVALDRQLITQRMPGQRRLGVQLGGAGQVGDRGGGLAHRRKGRAQFELQAPGAGIGGGEGLQHSHRRLRIARSAEGRAQGERGVQPPRGDRQDPARHRLGEVWLAAHQPPRFGQGGGDVV